MYRSELVCTLAFCLMLTSASSVCAQSWGQYKQAAVQAESDRDFTAAQEYWQKALDESEPGGPRYAQCLAGLARNQDAMNKQSDADVNYKKLVELIPAGGNLDSDSRTAIKEYIAFLRKAGKEAEAAEQEKKYGLGVPTEATQAPATASSKKSTTEGHIGADGKLAEQLATLVRSGADQLSKRQFAPAERALKEALIIAENLKDFPNTKFILSKLIFLASEQKQFGICEEHSARMVILERQHSGAKSGDYAQALSAHAGWLRKLNRRQEAMAEEAKAESILVNSDLAGSGTAQTSPGGVDVSGTKGGSIYSRSRAAQSGFTDRVNKLLEQD